MASEGQVGFFNKLADERQFPDHVDVTQLKSQFANLDTASASEWIEKALTLPEKGKQAPPF